MIRTIKVELNAAYPEMPIPAFQVFHDSAAAVTILNVPRRITGVYLSIKNVSAVTQTFTAQRNGSAWEAIVPDTFFSQSGTSEGGVKIHGTDASSNDFVLGSGDLVVLLDDGTVSPVSPAGDMKHSEFSSLDADTSSLAEVITLLKGQTNA